MTCFEEHLYTAAASNYGNMYGYIIEKICCTEFNKSTILSKSKSNIYTKYYNSAVLRGSIVIIIIIIIII